MLLKFIILCSLTSCIQSFHFDEVKEKESFKKYFIKAYHLRFKDDEKIAHANRTKHVFRRAVTVSSEKFLRDSFERYKQLSKTEKFHKVSRNGTSDQKLDLVAEEIWDRIGADAVEKTFIMIGAKGGELVGGSIGGSLGMAIGIALTPLQLPLVIDGVFIGKRLGSVLGAIGGKIAADFVNDLITNDLISKYIVKKLYTAIKEYFGNATNSPELTCRSDTCFKGFAESKCKCVPCNGLMEYSDVDGAPFCKKCKSGTVPLTQYGYHIGCSPCSRGTIGKKDGNCYDCNGAMQYGDTEGATSCKICPPGTVPKTEYGYNIGCSKCRLGTIGKKDGNCYYCDGVMQYGDTKGATSCKTCPLGTVPLTQYGYHIGCSKCGLGTIGKKDGKCDDCNGATQYGDTEGATSCKTCPVGSVPEIQYGSHIGCEKCSLGKIGKEDGKCYDCAGAMQYGDTEGATSCKTCPVRSVPEIQYGSHIGCSNCRVGTIGKKDGKCDDCNGAMQYGDTEGATSCKICSLGTVPFVTHYGYHIGCSPCSRGTIGKKDGNCYDCNGAMQYGDTEGATSCKICSLGTVPLVTHYGYHIGCSPCSRGKIGKKDGNCYDCNGAMQYGDTEGATSCKTCSLGSVPLVTHYGDHIGCLKCPKGTIGKIDGNCYDCNGAMQYGDTEGATSCKTCPLGTVPVNSRNGFYGYLIKCLK